MLKLATDVIYHYYNKAFLLCQMFFKEFLIFMSKKPTHIFIFGTYGVEKGEFL